MRVRIEIEETELEGEDGRPIDGLIVKCTRCNHQVEVYGTSTSSIKRGAVVLRDECPEDETNFYYDEDED
jgi:hypothetical protein